MKRLNIHEAKTHLSRHLADLADGETIILCKRNVPIAEIKGFRSQKGKRPRPIGLAKGEFEVPKAFFDPLPEDMIAAFDVDAP